MLGWVEKDNDGGSDYHLPQVWAEYLSQFEWDLYGHLSFRDYPHIESACKLFDLMIHEMNSEIYGKTYVSAA